MREVILTCDICGCKGHESVDPSTDCITALKDKLASYSRLRPVFDVWDRDSVYGYKIV